MRFVGPAQSRVASNREFPKPLSDGPPLAATLHIPVLVVEPTRRGVENCVAARAYSIQNLRMCPLKSFLMCLVASVAACAGELQPAWRGIHVMAPDGRQLPLVQRAIVEQFAPRGVNLLLFEVNYRFAWRTHPELAEAGAITREQARELATVCQSNHIRLVPLFNCLGHQSWAARTAPLLAKHPEFDETPLIPADNRGIYCRSWCPQHPHVNEVVFALMDELLDAFAADALHVGLDEVFLIGHAQCERCHGQDPAKLFAGAVNDYHCHLVGKRKVEMMLWGDRLLDDATMNYGEWEASRNGTAGALALIPKDIIICDWHYEPRTEYPSVPFFQQQGFRVLPSSWRNRDAALALLDYARAQNRGKVIGHLCTTWAGADEMARAFLGDAGEVAAQTRQIAETTKACLDRLSKAAPAGAD